MLPWKQKNSFSFVASHHEKQVDSQTRNGSDDSVITSGSGEDDGDDREDHRDGGEHGEHDAEDLNALQHVDTATTFG